MDTAFQMQQLYDAPPENVWRALTQESSLRAWYFPQLRKFELVVGSAVEFANDDSPYQKEWRVTRIVAGRLLAHSWAYHGYPGRSEVTFDVVAEGHKTRLQLTHTGLASFPQDPHFARQRFADGWQQLLGSNLKQYLATHD